MIRWPVSEPFAKYEEMVLKSSADWYFVVIDLID